jgi:hypothetical protein
MGRSKPWMVALLTVLVAMTVGFGKLDPHRRWAARPVGNGSNHGDVGSREAAANVGPQADPVSEFLTDLVGPDAEDGAGGREEESPPVPLPLIRELPPLPEAYWPAPRRPFTHASGPSATAASR